MLCQLPALRWEAGWGTLCLWERRRDGPAGRGWLAPSCGPRPPERCAGFHSPALSRCLARASLRGRWAAAGAGRPQVSLRLTRILPGVLRLGAQCQWGCPWVAALEGWCRLIRGLCSHQWDQPRREPQIFRGHYPCAQLRPPLTSTLSLPGDCAGQRRALCPRGSGTCPTLLSWSSWLGPLPQPQTEVRGLHWAGWRVCPQAGASM